MITDVKKMWGKMSHVHCCWLGYKQFNHYGSQYGGPLPCTYIKGSVSSHMDISTVMFSCYTIHNNKEIEPVDDVNQQMNGSKYGIYTKKYFTHSQRETKWWNLRNIGGSGIILRKPSVIKANSIWSFSYIDDNIQCLDMCKKVTTIDYTINWDKRTQL